MERIDHIISQELVDKSMKEAQALPLKKCTVRKAVFIVTLDIDQAFWALLPALNLNLHSKTLEFEFLCFGLYIDYK